MQEAKSNVTAFPNRMVHVEHDSEPLLLTEDLGNYIPLHQDFLDRLTAYLVQYRRRKFNIDTVENDLIQNVLAQAHYVRLLLSKIEEKHGQVVPDFYTYRQPMDLLARAFEPVISGFKSEETLYYQLTIADRELSYMIQTYYTPAIERPFWLFLSTILKLMRR